MVGGNGLAQVWASVGWGASEEEVVWPAWMVTQGQEEPSSAHRSPGDVLIPENNCGQWAELCQQCQP